MSSADVVVLVVAILLVPLGGVFAGIDSAISRVSVTASATPTCCCC